MVSFRNRLNCLDETSERFLGLLVSLGGYCAALQGQELIGRSGGQARVRLRTLERLGFLRRITKYPVVYQVTKSTTRLLNRDSSSRRRHTLPTVQSRLLGVHFYLEARTWPAEFVLDHDRKVEVFTDLARCPSSVLPQRDGKPYLRERFLLWQQDWRLAIAMVDQPQPGMLLRLKVFIREFLPLLRHLRREPDLLVVTANKGRSYVYERLLKRHRAIHKLGLGELSNLIRTYCVKPPVVSIAGLTWPTTNEHGDVLEAEVVHHLSHSDTSQRHSRELIYE